MLVVGCGLLLILIILSDAFETIVLPRRVTRRVRLSRQFIRLSWRAWSAVGRRLPAAEDPEGASLRDRFLSIYGPLVLLLLVGVWAAGLVGSFALVFWGLQPQFPVAVGRPSFGTLLYLSGETFFTLGYGDVAPLDTPGRIVAVLEVATGFTFLALIIGYLPVIYQAFSRREVNITLLDARAGSPPSATELLRRMAVPPDPVVLDQFLQEWEHWAADVLESHLSYPVLCFFRSQHEHVSWLASITMILDACSLLMVGVESAAGPLPTRQARLTFAMVRHAVGDLSQILYVAPRTAAPNRLTAADLQQVGALLADVGLELRSGAEAERSLAEVRRLYEPYVDALAERLLFTLPSWLPSTIADDWQTTAWEWEPAHLPPLSRTDRG
jgi:hypothetical protein